jgi:primosomal protein N'
MLQCPKCNGWRIGGPRYVKLPYGRETLRYFCHQCGYEEDQPTRDNEKAAQSIADAVCFGWRP